MPLVVAERTIDSLFVFELISVAPTAVVISPNNNAGPRTPDHELRGATRTFVFECKTLYASHARPTDWVIRVPRRQLADYVAHGQAALIYVLPASPTTRTAPWLRTCRVDPDASGYCRACVNPPRSEGAAYRRRWAGTRQPIASAPVETRLQPWFNHWAWCVRADALHRYLSANPGFGQPTAEISAEDLDLHLIPGATRLCHLLQDIRRDHDAIHGVGPGWEGAEPTETGSGSGDRAGLETSLTHSLQAFEIVENDRRLIVGY